VFQTTESNLMRFAESMKPNHAKVLISFLKNKYHDPFFSLKKHSKMILSKANLIYFNWSASSVNGGTILKFCWIAFRNANILNTLATILLNLNIKSLTTLKFQDNISWYLKFKIFMFFLLKKNISLRTVTRIL
jgi:hypothetical protein